MKGLVGAFKDYFVFDYRCLFPLVLNLGYKNSLVHGFISDDGVFEGKIHVGNDEYFVESAKQYFKDAPQDFHSVIYESRDVHYPHAYGPGCGISEKSKRWMDKVKRYTVSQRLIKCEMTGCFTRIPLMVSCIKLSHNYGKIYGVYCTKSQVKKFLTGLLSPCF